MCDNELIRVNPLLLLYQQTKRRVALADCPLPLSSYCPLIDIGFFAHDLKNTFAWLCHVAPQLGRLWHGLCLSALLMSQILQITSLQSWWYTYRIYSLCINPRWSLLSSLKWHWAEMRWCPAALAHSQMGRTNLAYNGDFNYSLILTAHLSLPPVIQGGRRAGPQYNFQWFILCTKIPLFKVIHVLYHYWTFSIVLVKWVKYNQLWKSSPLYFSDSGWKETQALGLLHFQSYLILIICTHIAFAIWLLIVLIVLILIKKHSVIIVVIFAGICSKQRCFLKSVYDVCQHNAASPQCWN